MNMLAAFARGEIALFGLTDGKLAFGLQLEINSMSLEEITPSA
jgi:hypothetical protein